VIQLAQKKYYAGDTVRIIFSFFDYGNELVDPTIVKVLFYNSKFVKIGEAVMGADNKISTGNYYYDYTSSSSYRDTLYYETYGEVNGFPSISRASMEFVFI